MTCPYLRYRSSDGEYEFDHERPYCAVEEQFVSPMRADICNARYEFAPDTHCDIYRRVRFVRGDDRDQCATDQSSDSASRSG